MHLSCELAQVSCRGCCAGLQGVAQKLTVTWADPERRMLKRKFQDGSIAPSPNYHKPMTSVPPGEEREVRQWSLAPALSLSRLSTGENCTSFHQF